MAIRKFTIYGREYESYHLINEQIVRLLKDDSKACSEDRNFLMKKVFERFEYDLCKRGG